MNLEFDNDGLLLSESASDTSTASYFYLSYNRPDEAIEKPRRQPQHLNIIWDASDSNRKNNHTKELQLLDAYFQQLHPEKPTKVTLQILRNSLVDAGDYSVSQGDWKKLRAVLESMFYDGSTNYACIKDAQHQADLTLIFTDSMRKEDVEMIQINQQQTTCIIHRGAVASLVVNTRRAFGVCMNLTQSTVGVALHLLTHTRYRVEHVVTENTSIFEAASSRPDKQCDEAG